MTGKDLESGTGIRVQGTKKTNLVTMLRVVTQTTPLRGEKGIDTEKACPNASKILIADGVRI